MTVTTPTISPELKGLLRRVKLGKTLDTLPERLTLAATSKLSHAEFLELVLADEVDRRNRQSAALRAKTARLDPSMTLEAWDPDANVTYDQAMWAELTSLRFLEDAHKALILGPVGVGKTHLAHALGHIACRRGHKVHAERADRLFRRQRATRLDHLRHGTTPAARCRPPRDRRLRPPGPRPHRDHRLLRDRGRTASEVGHLDHLEP